MIEKIKYNKINISFTGPTGLKSMIIVDTRTSVGELLKKYLKSINRSDLINRNDKFIFLHNSYKLRLDDMLEVGHKFHDGDRITVIKGSDLIGG